MNILTNPYRYTILCLLSIIVVAFVWIVYYEEKERNSKKNERNTSQRTVNEERTINERGTATITCTYSGHWGRTLQPIEYIVSIRDNAGDTL